MTLKTELTSDGKHVLLRGRATKKTQERLREYKVRHMLYKVPLDVFCKDGWRARHDAEPLPQRLIDLAQRDAAVPDDSAVLMPGLYAFQEKAVRYIIGTLKGRAILADDMGLGKTRQAIALLKHYGPPCLVICPAFLKNNWTECAKQHSVPGVTIVSYDKLRTAKLDCTQWHAVVADEAHYIKQKDALRTQAALPIIMSAKFAILCTGTPCPSRCEELFTLMHALRPTIVTSFRWFANRYCDAKRTRFSAFDTTGSSRREELRWLLQRAFMVRRTKAQVLHQLPQKHQSTVWVKCAREWTHKIECMREKFEDAMDAKKMSAAKCLVSDMFRATCQAKLTPAVQYAVHTIEACTSCCLVFAHHKSMLDALEHATRHMTTVRIDGDTPMKKRLERVQLLQEGNVQAALLSMGAAGVGLTMTRANRVLFLELPWTPATLRQCEDRVHRIGQKNPCFVTYVMAQDTIDGHVWDRLQGKESLIGSIM